jgi:hypothetical protein
MESYTLKLNKNGHIGYAVIINNYLFDPPRTGSSVDVQRIELILKTLRFEVRKPDENLTSRKMKELATHLTTSVDFTNYSSFLCVIMSHGGKKCRIEGVDGKSVRLLNDLIKPFTKCASLHKKPKIFFVDACHWKYLGKFHRIFKQKKDKTEDEDDTSAKKFMLNIELPKDTDVLLQYSAFEYNPCYRDKIFGSYYILILCHVLSNQKLISDYEIDTLLRIVSHRMILKHGTHVPQLVNSLRKSFYFICDTLRERYIFVSLNLFFI